MNLFKYFILYLAFLQFIFTENPDNITKTTNKTNQSEKNDAINQYLIKLNVIESNISINERKLFEITTFRQSFMAATSPNIIKSQAYFKIHK